MKNLITLKAAHDFLSSEQSSKFTNLASIQQLIAGPTKSKKQGWTYYGDWSKVSPIFHGRPGALG